MSPGAWGDLWDDSEKEEIVPQSSFNSMKLAEYFRKLFQAAPWSGFAVVNIRTMAGAIKHWKDKTDSATMMSMMDLYMQDASLRGKNPGWQDFLYRAEQINAKLAPVVVEDKWARYEREWEETNGKDSA
jgi:hypothetical protein